MRFLNKSLSALFAVTLLLFLASNFATSRTFAQETSNKEACPLPGFFIASGQSCKAKPQNNTSKEFLPTQTLTSTKPPEETKEPKQTQGNIKPETYYISESPTESTLSADLLFSLTNEYRTKIGKSPFEKEALVCSVAEQRREEIRQEIFVTHFLHSGFYAMNLPYYATENMIWQHTETEALNWWINSPVHRATIEGDYKYACGVCNGKVCSMVYTNYEPRVVVKTPTVLTVSTN